MYLGNTVAVVAGGAEVALHHNIGEQAGNEKLQASQKQEHGEQCPSGIGHTLAAHKFEKGHHSGETAHEDKENTQPAEKM